MNSIFGCEKSACITVLYRISSAAAFLNQRRKPAKTLYNRCIAPHLSVEKYNSYNAKEESVVRTSLLTPDHSPINGPLDFRMDLSRFDAAPLIAFIAAKETNYGNETDGRIPR
ncbi:MAG: hypothetical protein AAFY80_02005 [Pseudomonadota bacterium]